jgi:hypothetical protein
MRPFHFFAFWGVGLRKLGAYSAPGADKGIDGEITMATQHCGDARRSDAHTLSELGTVDALALHELEQFFHGDEFPKFNLLFEVEWFGKGLCEWVAGFISDDFHCSGWL